MKDNHSSPLKVSCAEILGISEAEFSARHDIGKFSIHRPQFWHNFHSMRINRILQKAPQSAQQRAKTRVNAFGSVLAFGICSIGIVAGVPFLVGMGTSMSIYHLSRSLLLLRNTPKGIERRIASIEKKRAKQALKIDREFNRGAQHYLHAKIAHNTANLFKTFRSRRSQKARERSYTNLITDLQQLLITTKKLAYEDLDASIDQMKWLRSTCNKLKDAVFAIGYPSEDSNLSPYAAQAAREILPRLKTLHQEVSNETIHLENVRAGSAILEDALFQLFRTTSKGIVVETESFRGGNRPSMGKSESKKFEDNIDRPPSTSNQRNCLDPKSNIPDAIMPGATWEYFSTIQLPSKLQINSPGTTIQKLRGPRDITTARDLTLNIR